MPNVSRKALGEVIKRSLPSNKQHMAGAIMRKAGVDPKYGASLKGYEAKAVLKKLKSEGVLNARASHLTANEFERQLKKADAPTGPNPSVAKAGKLVAQRERLLEEEKKKEEISKALSRASTDKKPSAPAARPQMPLVGGRVVGQAAHDATKPSVPASADRPEAIDPYGED